MLFEFDGITIEGAESEEEARQLVENVNEELKSMGLPPINAKQTLPAEALRDLECELCLFTDHCDHWEYSPFCMKDFHRKRISDDT